MVMSYFLWQTGIYRKVGGGRALITEHVNGVATC